MISLNGRLPADVLSKCSGGAKTGPDVDPFILHLFAALAEKERAMISARTKAALAAARARGVALVALSSRKPGNVPWRQTRPWPTSMQPTCCRDALNARGITTRKVVREIGEQRVGAGGGVGALGGAAGDHPFRSGEGGVHAGAISYNRGRARF